MTTDTDHLAERRAEFSKAMETLPTVEELARPLVESILRLHFLGDVMRTAEFLSDNGDYVDDVATLVHLIEKVASYAECVVANCTIDRDLAPAMRQIVLHVSGGDNVRTSYHRNHLTINWMPS